MHTIQHVNLAIDIIIDIDMLASTPFCPQHQHRSVSSRLERAERAVHRERAAQSGTAAERASRAVQRLSRAMLQPYCRPTHSSTAL
jgi:hypothetical protein